MVYCTSSVKTNKFNQIGRSVHTNFYDNANTHETVLCMRWHVLRYVTIIGYATIDFTGQNSNDHVHIASDGRLTHDFNKFILKS